MILSDDKSLPTPADTGPSVPMHEKTVADAQAFGDQLPPPNEELPDYAASLPHPQRALTTHSNDLTKPGNSTPWLEVKLHSLAASPKHVPYFFQEQPIKGIVELNLEKPEYFVTIEIAVVGITNGMIAYFGSDFITSQDKTWLNEDIFYQTRQTLWAAQSGTKPSLLDRLRQHEGEKLEGRHTFNFSITVPKDAKMRGKDGYPLPPYFVERGARASVEYELGILVKRGTFGVDSHLEQKIALFPVITPPPFSLLRAAAYAEGHGSLAGPLDDPDGWESLPELTITGDLFGVRSADIKYKLSLAKPLVYTRGTYIPLSLAITSSDSQALDILSGVSAPVVKLMAHMNVRPRRAEKEARSGVESLGSKDEQWYIDTRDIQTAVWSTEPINTSPDTRFLLGEIHLSPTICPDFDAPDIKLEYTVNVLEPVAAGFAFKASHPARSGVHYGVKRTQALQTRVVNIATQIRGGEGQRPRALLPPSYEPPGDWPMTIAVNPGFYS